MRRLLPVLAIALLGLPVRAEPQAPDPLEKRSGAAIDKGVAYLLEEQKPDGSWSGQDGNTALALLALHRSGLRPGHKRFDRGFRWLMRSRKDVDKTYETSLRIMLLADVNPKKHGDAIRKLALRLVMSQCENGQWTYKAIHGKVKKQGDNSNTQFALLALWYARLAGATVHPAIWNRSGRHFRATQNPDGGWGYSHNQRRDSYGSMTAGGLMSMTVITAARSIGKVDLEALQANEHIAKGRAWLARELLAAKNPGVEKAFGKQGARKAGAKKRTDYFPLYWLWSLERAGRLLELTNFGEHDWYAEGAEHLVDTQRDDGRWVGSVPVRATSFALLFLTRGTKPVTTEPITGTATTPR